MNKKMEEERKKNMLSGIGGLFYKNQGGGLLDLNEIKEKKKRA